MGRAAASDQLSGGLRAAFLRRRHTALLVAIVLAFAVRPLIGNAGIAPLVFSLALTLLMIVALYTIQVDELLGDRDVLVAQRRRRSIAGWALAIPAIAERLLAFLFPDPRVFFAGSITWLLFFGFVTWSELRSVLRQREITGETISMSISIYLLLGLTWGTLYIVMFQVSPDAFNLGASVAVATAQPIHVELFPTFIYFSLSTLATIGFGDITPISMSARYAAVAEGITGQFYLAILVARLVGLQMSGPRHRDS